MSLFLVRLSFWTERAGDLSDAAQADALLARLKAEGEIDVLINNTGIFEVKAFEEINDEEWMQYFNVNVLSAVRLSRALLPAMLERDYGRDLGDPG